MGPTELAISGLIAVAAAFPIAAMMDTGAASTPPVPDMHNYVLKPDCVGEDGSIGPCVICSKTGMQLGVAPKTHTIN